MASFLITTQSISNRYPSTSFIRSFGNLSHASYSIQLQNSSRTFSLLQTPVAQTKLGGSSSEEISLPDEEVVPHPNPLLGRPVLDHLANHSLFASLHPDDLIRRNPDLPFLPFASQLSHPLNLIRRMASSGAKKRRPDSRFSQKHPAFFMPAGLEPVPASNSPHSVDWSMDGSGPTEVPPRFESPSRRTQQWSDGGSQRHTQQRSHGGSQRHTQQRSDGDSRNNAPNGGQFRRPGKLLTEKDEKARELTRLKAQQRADRRMLALQTKKDRAARRQVRKEQKLQDHEDELERRRQIRIRGENDDMKSALIYFPTSIELTTKNMKKLKKVKPTPTTKETTVTKPVGNANDSRKPLSWGTPNLPLVSPEFHNTKVTRMQDSQPRAGSSREVDKSYNNRLNSTDRWNPHQAAPPYESPPVNLQDNIKPVVTPQARTTSEPQEQKVTSAGRSSILQSSILQAQQNYSSVTHDRNQPDQYPPVMRGPPPGSTQARNSRTHYSSPMPHPLSAGCVVAQDLPSPSRPIANHEELHYPLAHSPNGRDPSRNTPPHQTPLSSPSSYTTTQSKDAHISSLPPTPNRDSPPHRIPSLPPFAMPPLLETGDFALKNQLVKMYMNEEGTTNPTPEQNQRSEIEFGWLKTAAQREIQKTRIGSFSPTSLSDHLRVQVQTDSMVQELLKEWIGEYTVNQKPIAYIIGDVPFGNIQIAVQPPILIPRPETEQWTCKLSEMIKTWNDPDPSNRSQTEQSEMTPKFGKKDLKILDIGTGSGCIPTYLAYNHPNIFVMGIDVDHHAIELAKRNAFSHGLTFFQRQALQNTRSKVIQHRGQASFMNVNVFSSTFVEDVINGLRRKSELTNQDPINGNGDKDEKFDMIISNPPYITKNEYKTLPSSVKNWESGLSLIGDKQLSINHQLLSRSQSLQSQFRTTESFHQPIPFDSSSLLPKTVSMMQELGLKLPKKTRKSLNSDDVDDDDGKLMIGSGKDDGLDFYKVILDHISKGQLLKRLDRIKEEEAVEEKENLPRILLEVGNGQAEDVKGLMIKMLMAGSDKPISKVEIWNDFFGVARVVVGF